VLHLMRVTVEAASPISIGRGEMIDQTAHGAGIRPEDQHYMVAAIVHDANGLPALPGASLQGVLRTLYEGQHGVEATKDLFGFVHSERFDVRAGRLIVGWGGVHDQHGVAVVGQRIVRAGFDPVLDGLANPAPLERDHVALNARHVADGRRKFARAAVPRGTRFSVEFALWGDPEGGGADRACLASIAGLFSHPIFRLGGSTGRGYGKVELVSATLARPDLGNAAALRELRAEPPSHPFKGKTADLRRERDFKHSDRQLISRAKVNLRPINPWRVGGRHGGAMTQNTHGVRLDGDTPVFDAMDLRSDEREVQTILREPKIRWNKAGKGEWRASASDGPFEFPVPGSAIKGPLAHRAVFHFNRRDAERVIDVTAWRDLSKGDRAARLSAAGSRPEALEALFGAAKEKSGQADGRAARLLVGDGRAEVSKRETAVQAVDHNSIDRFTGGVREGALYAEEVLANVLNVTFEFTILPPFDVGGNRGEPGEMGWPDTTIDPFLDALADLCQGRLAIGAKSLGFCLGEVSWSGPAKAAWEKRWRARSGK
jgi:CRISPR/Cas system CSM-associated protein Csm3 (group 7 of RAMP superfamily)